jgi:hypothetical protein
MENSKFCILDGMKRLFTFSLTCIIFITACGPYKSQYHFNNGDSSKIVRLNVDTSIITIFDFKTEGWARKKFKGSKPFNLVDNDIKTIEQVFSKCHGIKNIDTSYFHYERQYIPFTNKDGRKKVWINCFCSNFGNDYVDWKKSIVLVSDGGSCFFNVIINLSDHSFSNLSVNGNG